MIKQLVMKRTQTAQQDNKIRKVINHSAYCTHAHLDLLYTNTESKIWTIVNF